MGEATRDGRELIEAVLKIARGQDAKLQSERSRTWALEFLSDRLWGRAPQSIQLTASEQPAEAVRLNYDALTGDEIEEFNRLMAKIAQHESRELAAMPLAQLRELAGGDAVAEAQDEIRGMTLEQLREVAAGTGTGPRPALAAGTAAPDLSEEAPDAIDEVPDEP